MFGAADTTVLVPLAGWLKGMATSCCLFPVWVISRIPPCWAFSFSISWADCLAFRTMVCGVVGVEDPEPEFILRPFCTKIEFLKVYIWSNYPFNSLLGQFH